MLAPRILHGPAKVIYQAGEAGMFLPAFLLQRLIGGLVADHLREPLTQMLKIASGGGAFLSCPAGGVVGFVAPGGGGVHLRLVRRGVQMLRADGMLAGAAHRAGLAGPKQIRQHASLVRQIGGGKLRITGGGGLAGLQRAGQHGRAFVQLRGRLAVGGKERKRLGQPVPLAPKFLQAILLRLCLRFALPRLLLRGLSLFDGGRLFQNALIQRGQPVPFPQGRLFQPPHGAGAARPVQRLRQRVHFRLPGAQ